VKRKGLQKHCVNRPAEDLCIYGVINTLIKTSTDLSD